MVFNSPRFLQKARLAATDAMCWGIPAHSCAGRGGTQHFCSRHVLRNEDQARPNRGARGGAFLAEKRAFQRVTQTVSCPLKVWQTHKIKKLYFGHNSSPTPLGNENMGEGERWRQDTEQRFLLASGHSSLQARPKRSELNGHRTALLRSLHQCLFEAGFGYPLGYAFIFVATWQNKISRAYE